MLAGNFPLHVQQSIAKFTTTRPCAPKPQNPETSKPQNPTTQTLKTLIAGDVPGLPPPRAAVHRQVQRRQGPAPQNPKTPNPQNPKPQNPNPNCRKCSPTTPATCSSPSPSSTTTRPWAPTSPWWRPSSATSAAEKGPVDPPGRSQPMTDTWARCARCVTWPPRGRCWCF
jgi:hypothetical protein